jgi:hypothetical protein
VSGWVYPVGEVGNEADAMGETGQMSRPVAFVEDVGAEIAVTSQLLARPTDGSLTRDSTTSSAGEHTP